MNVKMAKVLVNTFRIIFGLIGVSEIIFGVPFFFFFVFFLSGSDTGNNIFSEEITNAIITLIEIIMLMYPIMFVVSILLSENYIKNGNLRYAILSSLMPFLNILLIFIFVIVTIFKSRI